MCFIKLPSFCYRFLRQLIAPHLWWVVCLDDVRGVQGVFARRYPFQIFDIVVEFVAVFVIDLRFPFWVRNGGYFKPLPEGIRFQKFD